MKSPTRVLRQRTRRPLAMIAAVLALSAPTLAEPPAHRRGPGAGAGLGDTERANLRGRLQQKIQTYLTVELSSRASLDEKKSLQLAAALKTHLERMEKRRNEHRASLGALQKLVDQKADDAALRAQLKVLLAQGGKGTDLQALLDDTSKFLTVTEQAKVTLAMRGVLQDVRRMIRQARHNRGPKPGAFGPGPMGDVDNDDDDDDDAP